jgi:MoaA/NifB/PqqE/SkfB family radical SAM enzyme
MNLSILYRGPLSSCNYGCVYCPFAKRRESREELMADRRALERFTAWVSARTLDSIAVFFTPWGEALIRRSYQRALAALTAMPHVRRAAIQTNLACRLDWVTDCNERNRQKLALWATFHPTEVRRARFVAQCKELALLGVRVSAGVVGLREHFDEILALRAELPESVYVWVNAYRREPDYYTEDDVRLLESVDPLFRVNTRSYPSLGASCRAGLDVISVAGDGTARRCHFIDTPIGNIYEEGFDEALKPRPCTNQTCRCHIGYVHLDYLELDKVFGAGILERIPEGWPARPAIPAALAQYVHAPSKPEDRARRRLALAPGESRSP